MAPNMTHDSYYKNEPMFMKTPLLKHLFFLLLMLLGCSGAWGQKNYSGDYYIASKSTRVNGVAGIYTYDASTPAGNYYLCPTEGWYYYEATNNYTETPNNQPFLTTFKCKSSDYDDATKAIWVVEKKPETNCYYFKQWKTGRYMISNGQISGSANQNRMRVHLEEVTDPSSLDDKALFEFYENQDHLYIKPHSDEGKSFDLANNKVYDYLVVNNGNLNELRGNSSKPDGPNGTYGKNTGGVISLYTAEDNGYWHLEDAHCATPTISINNITGEATVESATTGASFYYTTASGTGVPATPTDEYENTLYESGIALNDPIITISVVAMKDAMLPSTVTTKKIVYMPTITLDGVSFTYDGTGIEPAISSVVAGETPISDTDYDVTYENNTNAGTATVIITNKLSSDYIIYGSTTFTINKATITPTVTIDNWEWSTSPSTPTLTGSTDNEAVITYEYKVKGAADGTYDDDVPNEVGEYTLRATIGETGNTYGGTATVDFEITPKSIGDGVRASEGFTITLEEDGEGSYSVTVKDGGTILTEDTHYTVTEDGELVTVAGKGNYAGSAKFVFANAKFESTGASGEYAAAYRSGMDIFPPNVITPYVVKKVNASIGTLTIAKLDYIPEGVPVLLLAESDLASFTASPIEESTDPISPALLSGNPLKVAPVGGVRVEDTEAYLFYKGEFVLTFAGTISAGSFFLYNPDYTPAPPSGSSPRRYLRIEKEEDDATTLNNGQWTMDDEIYDLCGRRVKGQLPKGIYIVNGQKRLIK